MAVSPSQISFVLSGGVSNTDPDASLGGDPSAFPIPEGINNLFDNVSGVQSEAGSVEYRAFYIFNDSTDSYIRNVKLWVESQVDDGASIEIGMNLDDEIQRITITPADDIISGNFKIQVLYYINESATVETTGEIDWDLDLDIVGQNIETALNALDVFSEITVQRTVDGIFLVTFTGEDGNTAQPTLNVIENTLISSGDDAEISVELIIQGSPINNLASDIGTENIAPSGISFSNPDEEGNSLDIGVIGPSEGFPVWIKRTVLAGTEGLEADGFTLRIQVTTP